MKQRTRPSSVSCPGCRTALPGFPTAEEGEVLACPSCGEEYKLLFGRQMVVTDVQVLDATTVYGPCARCGRTDHERYGDSGRPLCDGCLFRAADPPARAELANGAPR